MSINLVPFIEDPTNHISRTRALYLTFLHMIRITIYTIPFTGSVQDPLTSSFPPVGIGNLSLSRPRTLITLLTSVTGRDVSPFVYYL